MSKYINADAIEYHEIYDGQEFVRVAYGDDIDNIPSADVVEVVRGEWEMINPQLAKCSVCGGYESTNGKDMTGKGVIFKTQKKYCPHCGARMVEDEQIH